MVLVPKFIVPGHPHGESTTTRDDGVVEERDLLTCVHCMYTWEHEPGKRIFRFYPVEGRKVEIFRGTCTRCNGPTCGRDECRTCVDIRAAILDGTLDSPIAYGPDKLR